MTDTIKYSLLIDQAMRGMVRDVLRQLSGSGAGLPGDHHFYISLNTTHPGVVMSDQLRSKYPKEITVVLQHQFWDFKVEDTSFNVTLSFGGVPEKLTIPFAAMTAFADPSVKFGLQFQQGDTLADSIALAENALQMDISTDSAKDAASAEIISLESFRKK